MYIGKKIFLFLLLSSGVNCEDLKDDDDSELIVFYNPCTGSFSADEYDVTECLERSPSEAPKPIDEPSDDLEKPPEPPIDEPSDDPENPPEPPIDDVVDKFFCPGTDCSFDFESEENVLTIQYVYSIETDNSLENPSSALSQVEESLLSLLAPEILSACLANGNGRMLQTNVVHDTYTRRFLNPRRRLDPTGLCSFPDDVILTEATCVAEDSTKNSCSVVQGGISIALGEGDNTTALSESTIDMIQESMNDEDQSLLVLVQEDQPAVEKITFLGESIPSPPDDGNTQPSMNEPESVVDDGDSANIAVIAVGSAFAALAMMLVAFLIGRRKKEEEEEEEEGFGVIAFAGVKNGSFTPADSKDLGNSATAMDVHHCKSQTCAKCYGENQLRFVSVPKKKTGAFASDTNVEVAAARTKSEISALESSSDDNSVMTTEFY